MKAGRIENRLIGLIALCIAAFLPSSPAQNLAPNPSFENGISQPTSWELRYGPGVWATEGFDGLRSVAVTGVGDCGAMWMTVTNLQFTPGNTYVLRYVGKMSTFGGTGSSEIEGAGSRRAILSEGWGQYAYAAVMPTNVVGRRIRLGQCGMKGIMHFDNVELRHALPVHADTGDRLLGKGETISSNLFTFELKMADLRGNPSRALHQHTSSFRGDEWQGKWYWILAYPDFVIYRHHLDGFSFTNAKVRLNTLGSYGGNLLVEASSNGINWHQIVNLSPTNNKPVEASLPSSMLPAAEVFVRMRAMTNVSSPAAAMLYIHEYKFEANVPENLQPAAGNTWFFEEEKSSSMARITALKDTPTGFVASIAITNLQTQPRTFYVTTQTTGPETSRSAQMEIALPGSSFNGVSIPFLSGGVGENRTRVTIQEASTGEVVMDGFVWTQVSPIADDSYGALLSGSQDCAVWWCDATYKIGRQRNLPSVTSQGVSIAAARHEYEPFQVVLRPDTDRTNVNISITDFQNITIPGVVISSTNVEICAVEYVNVTLPTDPTCAVGEYPDPVVPTNNVSLAAGVNNPFWITVYVPKDVPAGLYEATLKFQYSQQLITVPVLLRVFNFTLPDSTHTSTAYNWDYDHNWHVKLSGTDYNTVTDLYLRNFARHRITPNFLYKYAPARYFRSTVNGQTVFTHDFVVFDAAMTKYMEEYSFNTLCAERVPWWGRSYTEPWNWHWTWEDHPKIMRPIADRLRQKGWMDKAFQFIFDEPQHTEAAAAVVREGARKFEEAVPGMKRLVTAPLQTGYHGYVDIWTPQLHYFDSKLADERKAQGEQTWWYVATSPRSPWPNLFIDFPAIHNRIRVWLAQRYGATGDLYWNTAWWITTGFKPRNPWIDPMTVAPTGSPWGNGDGVLLYPPVRSFPTNAIVAGPVNSLRLELVRESMEDGEYFWVLDQFISRAEMRLGPQHPTVLGARAARDAALDLVPSRTTFTKNPQDLYRSRIQLAEAIESLDDGAPFIVTHPLSKAMATNSSLVLRVEVLAWPLPSYQWFHNGVPMPSGTNAALVIEQLGPSKTGSYHVVVSNPAGVATSKTSTVQGYWSPAPAIVQQPVSLVRAVGEKAVFDVAAATKYPMTYYWHHNNALITSTDVTSSALLLTNLTTAHAGNYHVVLSNAAAMTTSAVARLTVLAPAVNTVLLPSGSVWKYHDQNIDLGTSWLQPGYNDSSWPFGPAELGYGEGDESTILSSASVAVNKPVTTYFRRTLEMPGDFSGGSLTGYLLADDAAVVHLNGTEIFRKNLPAGAISFATSALTGLDQEDAEIEYSTIQLPSHLVLAGTNTVAIEVHQYTQGSEFAFNPDAYWSFDESAQPWRDSVGNSDFSLVGPRIASLPGKVGGCVSNSASYSDHITAPHSPDLDFSGPFTIGGWYNFALSTTLDATCLTKGSQFRLYYTGTALNRFRFAVNGTYVQDSTSVAPSSWHFIIAWFDGTNAFIQVNNGNVSMATTGAPALTTSPLIALKKSGEPGGLACDEVFVYNRVLTPQERATLFASGIRAVDHSFEFQVVGTLAQRPEFLSAPISLTRTIGQNAAFVLSAVSSTPVGYEWKRNGISIAGATNTLLFLPNVVLDDVGQYTLSASNVGGITMSAPAQLNVIAIPTILPGTNGVSTNQFWFDITGPSGMPVVVETSTNLIHWTPSRTNIIENGSIRFVDPDSETLPRRFYRARFQ